MSPYEQALNALSNVPKDEPWYLVQKFPGNHCVPVMAGRKEEILECTDRWFHHGYSEEEKAKYFIENGFYLVWGPKKIPSNDNIKGKRLPSLKTLPWWKNADKS